MIIYLNGEQREIGEPTMLAALLGSPDTAGRRGVAVAVDGVVVPRGRHANTPLHEGARVEVVTAVQGG